MWNGQNKVFFRRLVLTPARPDCFLVVVRSQEFGHFHVGGEGWKSEESFLISLSEWRDQQEAMLLMWCGDWVQTDLRRHVLVRDDHVSSHACLRLEVSD